MDPKLLQEVRANINNKMKWNNLIEYCSWHTSVIHKHYTICKDYGPKNSQTMRQPNHTSQANGNPTPTTTSWNKSKPPNKPSNMGAKFKKLTPAEKEELAKNGVCFYCRKLGYNTVNYPLRKNQIRSTAGTITHEITDTEVTHACKITSAAQFIGKDPSTSYNKGSSSNSPLNIAKEHLLVTTKINDQLTKTLVDQQTAGADLISSKFCTFYNLPMYPLKNPITCEITMQGSKR